MLPLISSKRRSEHETKSGQDRDALEAAIPVEKRVIGGSLMLLFGSDGVLTSKPEKPSARPNQPQKTDWTHQKGEVVDMMLAA